MSRRPNARLVRRILGGLLLILLVSLGWGLRSALVAKSELEKVRADLTSLRDKPPTQRAEIRARLSADDQRARHAVSVLRQPGPWLAAQLPIVGRSLDAEQRVADAASAAVAAALDIEEVTTSLGTAGRVDLAALERAATRLQSRADRLHAPIKRLHDAPDSLMPGFVVGSVSAAQSQLGGVDTQLEKAAAAARALHGVLGGSGARTVLVVLENNAELRGTGGLVSTFSLGTIKDGSMKLTGFRDVKDVAADVARAVVVPSPPDYAAHYGPYRANTTLWRNTTMTPDVPTAASVLSEVAARTTGQRPDVVLLLDVPGLAKIVDATDPIVLDGKKVTGSELIRTLLVDAYVGPRGDAEQNARRARERQAADASLSALTSAPASLSLAKALAEAASGRHLALWSARPDEQRDLVLADAAGAVDPRGHDLALVVANNLGDSPGTGNKLDYYIDRKLVVKAVVGRTVATVTQTLTLVNRAPTGLAPYVEGAKRPGRILELVQMATSDQARILSFTSGGVSAVADKWTEDGSRRLVFVTDLGRDQASSWTLTYEVPIEGGRYTLDLFPQALARPAALDLSVTFADGASGQLTGGLGGIEQWDRTIRLVAEHDRPGLLQRVRDRISRFWNEPVSL